MDQSLSKILYENKNKERRRRNKRSNFKMPNEESLRQDTIKRRLLTSHNSIASSQVNQSSVGQCSGEEDPKRKVFLDGFEILM